MFSANDLSFFGSNHKSDKSQKVVITKPTRARTRPSVECLSVFVEGMKGQIKLEKVINEPIILKILKPIIHQFTLLNLSFSQYFSNFSFVFFSITVYNFFCI